MNSPHLIHVRHPYLDTRVTYYPILVVGAGASGIAMACQLKEKLAFDQFRVFDRQAGLGGTWWTNRYPGVACDVPSALYSYSFAPNYTSSQIYPSGEEYVEYLYNVAQKYHVIDKIQLNTNVEEIRYIEEDQEWEVTLCHLPNTQGYRRHINDMNDRDKKLTPVLELVRAKLVISCVGILCRPNLWPEDVSGRETFRGEIVHSSQWDHQIDPREKDIVVIGSGCSAAQIIPSLLKQDVKSVTQIMRTPPWINPRVDEPFGEKLYARFAPLVFRYFPVLGFCMRHLFRLYTELEWIFVFQEKSSFVRQIAENEALKHMRLKANPRYHQALTPTYSYGCKRRVFDSVWLESTHDSRFSLQTHLVERLEARSLVIRSSGEDVVCECRELPADIIILANGFQSTEFLHSLQVYGRQGLLLQNHWDQRGGPQAYMGAAVDGFPNFFLVVGPNTFVGHTSAILSIESTVQYIIRIITPILQGKVTTVEPTTEAIINWTERIQKAMEKTVFGSCNSWYQDKRGHNTIIYPRSQIDFDLRCKFPRYRDWKFVYIQERGLRRYSNNIMLALAIISLLAGLLWAGQRDWYLTSMA